jgi:hypothetical protein
MIALVGAACVLWGGCDSPKTSSIAGTKAYPLDVCPVSGEKLGVMGEPVVFAYKDQEIKLCCKKCRKDFDADPAKYLTKLTGK